MAIVYSRSKYVGVHVFTNQRFCSVLDQSSCCGNQTKKGPLPRRRLGKYKSTTNNNRACESLKSFSRSVLLTDLETNREEGVGRERHTHTQTQTQRNREKQTDTDR